MIEEASPCEIYKSDSLDVGHDGALFGGGDQDDKSDDNYEDDQADALQGNFLPEMVIPN